MPWEVELQSLGGGTTVKCTVRKRPWSVKGHPCKAVINTGPPSDISETKSVTANNHNIICKLIIVSLKFSVKLLLYDHGNVSGSFQDYA